MSKLTDEQITGIWIEYEGRELSWRRLLARAIESAATEPLLQRIAELERQLEEARKQMEAQKDEWLAWEAKRKALEEDAERLNWLAFNPVEALDLFGRVTGDFSSWPKWIRSDIDASMQKDQS